MSGIRVLNARLIAATNITQPVSESRWGHTKRGPLLGIPRGAPQLLDQPIAGAESAWAFCDSDNGGSWYRLGPQNSSSASATAEQMIGGDQIRFAHLPALRRSAGRVDLADGGGNGRCGSQSLLNAVPEAPHHGSRILASVRHRGFLVGSVVRIVMIASARGAGGRRAAGTRICCGSAIHWGRRSD